MCELNNSTKDVEPGKLIKKPGYEYMGFAVSFEVATVQTQDTHRDKIGRVGEPILRATDLFNVNRCCKDLKTKCTKAGHERIEKPAIGKNKRVFPRPMQRYHPWGFRISSLNVVYSNEVNYNDVIK